MKTLAKIWFYFALILYFLSGPAALPADANEMQVRYKYVGGEDNAHFYPIALARAAMEATKTEYGSYAELPYMRDVARKREFEELVQGSHINLGWSPKHAMLDQHAIRVSQPIYRGLLGTRVFIIHKDNQDAFSRVKTLHDLSLLIAGQGEGWRDVGIMRAAGLRVVTSPQYPALFGMLAAKRFDYLPRSIGEAAVDLAQAKGRLPDLVVEKDIVLTYPMPVYFYVNKHDMKLAERLTQGLQQLSASGELNTVWNRYHGSVIQALGLDRRRVISLENPAYPGKKLVPFWK